MLKKGQVTLEWLMLIIVAAIAALSVIKGYARMHVQDSMRKSAEGFSKDMYDANSGSWSYNTSTEETIVDNDGLASTSLD
jgi:uncharacterized protein (UPF0333 family)